MKLFGLFSLVIMLSIGVYIVLGVTPAAAPSDSEAPEQSVVYDKALDDAQAITGGSQVEIYDGVSVSESVRLLELSGRGLTGSLKAQVRHLQSLETLDISNNQFTGLPAEIGQLANLRMLNLANNPLTGLPHELGNLKNLEVLDLQGTQYSETDVSIIRAALPESVIIITS